MSYSATVFNVMIASPSDITAERSFVRQAIHEWNSVHSFKAHVVLMPVGWETHSAPMMGDRPQAIINGQILKKCDLLIAMFWTRLGTPTGEAESGTVEEIEEHLKAGKPAMIYFSSAPVQLDSVDEKQYKALKKFKIQCQERGLYESYDSPADFLEKVRRHLALTVNEHKYFTEKIVAATGAGDTIIPFPSMKGNVRAEQLPDLSDEARQLLVTSARRGGQIEVIEHVAGTLVAAGDRNFFEGEDARELARWKEAIRSLLAKHLILEQPGTSSGLELYAVTHAGYELSDFLN